MAAHETRHEAMHMVKERHRRNKSRQDLDTAAAVWMVSPSSTVRIHLAPCEAAAAKRCPGALPEFQPPYHAPDHQQRLLADWADRGDILPITVQHRNKMTARVADRIELLHFAQPGEDAARPATAKSPLAPQPVQGVTSLLASSI